MISIQYFCNGVKGVQHAVWPIHCTGQLGICLHIDIRCYAQVFLAGMHMHREYIMKVSEYSKM